MLTAYSLLWDAGVQGYHRYLLTGLAPEGRVRVWLENTKNPNTRLIVDKDIVVETVFGEKLAKCKKLPTIVLAVGITITFLILSKIKNIITVTGNGNGY